MLSFDQWFPIFSAKQPSLTFKKILIERIDFKPVFCHETHCATFLINVECYIPYILNSVEIVSENGVRIRLLNLLRQMSKWGWTRLPKRHKCIMTAVKYMYSVEWIQQTLRDNSLRNPTHFFLKTLLTSMDNCSYPQALALDVFDGQRDQLYCYHIRS